MLPANARCGDYVSVQKKGDDYFGLYGEIVERTESKVKVMIKDRILSYGFEDLRLAARTGRMLHEEIKEQTTSREPTALTADDYADLINFAIDIQDWEWATELVKRNNNYVK